MLMMGMGYTIGRQYRIEGYTFTFILNEFADLQEMIKLDKRHVEYKAKLTIFKVYNGEVRYGDVIIGSRKMQASTFWGINWRSKENQISPR